MEFGCKPVLVCSGDRQVDNVDDVRQESQWAMMFTDNIVICSESREHVEKKLERWRSALERKGMKLNRSKKKIHVCE